MPTRDLSHPLDDATTVYPGDPPVERRPAATHDANGYRVTELRLGSHAGTHVDAPSHTEPDGSTLDEFAVDRFVFDARVVDCSDKDAREAVVVDDLSGALDDADGPSGADGPSAADANASDAGMVVVRTGWDAHWGTDRYYDHPYLASEAARWCADRGLDVGVDALSPDPSPSERATGDDPEGVPAHRALLGAERVVVENLTGLAALPETFELRAYPLALPDGDGSPVRAVAEW